MLGELGIGIRFVHRLESVGDIMFGDLKSVLFKELKVVLEIIRFTRVRRFELIDLKTVFDPEGRIDGTRDALKAVGCCIVCRIVEDSLCRLRVILRFKVAQI